MAQQFLPPCSIEVAFGIGQDKNCLIVSQMRWVRVGIVTTTRSNLRRELANAPPVSSDRQAGQTLRNTRSRLPAPRGTFWPSLAASADINLAL